jgi:hypothetical protein
MRVRELMCVQTLHHMLSRGVVVKFTNMGNDSIIGTASLTCSSFLPE